MINYSDENVFNIKNKKCLNFDPYKEINYKLHSNKESIMVILILNLGILFLF